MPCAGSAEQATLVGMRLLVPRLISSAFLCRWAPAERAKTVHEATILLAQGLKGGGALLIDVDLDRAFKPIDASTDHRAPPRPIILLNSILLNRLASPRPASALQRDRRPSAANACSRSALLWVDAPSRRVHQERSRQPRMRAPFSIVMSLSQPPPQRAGITPEAESWSRRRKACRARVLDVPREMDQLNLSLATSSFPPSLRPRWLMPAGDIAGLRSEDPESGAGF